MWNYLKGKKTYATAALVIVGAATSYATGALSGPEAAQMIATGLLSAFLRNSIPEVPQQ